MKETRIRHFRRPHEHAREKTLVTEFVTADSETGQFLRRMEEQRLAKPCFLNIDMRGRVPGDCRRHVHNNRTFYLDDTSRRLFQEGLARYDGQYTVGVYEAIINGQHTNKAIRQRQDLARRDASALAASSRHQPQSSQAPADHARRKEPAYTPYNPGTVCFGYYQKRREPRLRYVTGVEVVLDGLARGAKTRDISASGLRVSIKGSGAANVGQTVSVTFTDFMEHDPREDISFAEIQYAVVGYRQKDTELLLRLALKEDRNVTGLRSYLRAFTEKNKQKYKLDVEDLYAEVAARLYEKIYIETTSYIPFFIGQNTDGELYIQILALTDGNLPLASFFQNDEHGYDFAPLCMPYRLQHLVAKSEMLLVMYRHKEGGRYLLHSHADIDVTDDNDLPQLIQYAFAHQEYCIAKVIVNKVQADYINRDTIESITTRLAEKSGTEAELLRTRIGELVAVGMLYDITEQLRRPVRELTAAADVAPNGDTAAYRTAKLQQRLNDGEVLAPRPHQECIKPITVRFGYVERRREDRYLVETKIKADTGAGKFDGITIDLSTRGLRVQLESRSDIRVGEELTIHLVSLQKKRPDINLKKIPYRVMGKPPAPSTALMLERISARNDAAIDSFFLEVITKNRHKLTVDTEDVRNATMSLMYGGLLAQNVASVPFFITKGDDGSAVVQCVAVTEQPCDLARFLMLKDGDYYFTMITSPHILQPVYQAMNESRKGAASGNSRTAACEMEIYMYKTFDPASGAYAISSASSLEFPSENERKQFIAQALKHGDYRFVKLTTSHARDIDRAQIDLIVDIIRENSRYRASQLRDELEHVVGLGEMIDVTQQIARFYS